MWNSSSTITTSLHLEIDDADQGVGDEDWWKAAWRRVPRRIRRRANGACRKNGRVMPRTLSGLGGDARWLPVRHWVFPGHTVDVGTVAQVKDDLRGWQLRRCVFVGRCGNGFAREPHKARGEWGQNISCVCPCAVGDEVTREVLQASRRYQRNRGQPTGQGSCRGEGKRLGAMSCVITPKKRKRQRSPSSADPTGTRSRTGVPPRGP